MNNLTDLKALWHTAPTGSLPTSAQMLQLIKKFRKGHLRKKWLVIICALALAGLMVGVMFTYHSKMATTRIGEVMMALSSLLLAATNLRSLGRFKQLDNCSNLEFLAFIEQTRQNQIYYYKKTQVYIMLLCSVGLLLYLYEAVAGKPLWMAGMYGGTLIYLVVMWLIVRPRYFKKDAQKLQALRQHYEKMAQQLNEI